MKVCYLFNLWNKLTTDILTRHVFSNCIVHMVLYRLKARNVHIYTHTFQIANKGITSTNKMIIVNQIIKKGLLAC